MLTDISIVRAMRTDQRVFPDMGINPNYSPLLNSSPGQSPTAKEVKTYGYNVRSASPISSIFTLMNSMIGAGIFGAAGGNSHHVA